MRAVVTQAKVRNSYQPIRCRVGGSQLGSAPPIIAVVGLLYSFADTETSPVFDFVDWDCSTQVTFPLGYMPKVAHLPWLYVSSVLHDKKKDICPKLIIVQ